MPRFDWRTIAGTIIVLIALAWVAQRAGVSLPKPLKD